MAKMRIAVVGGGAIGQAHMQVLARSDSCTLSALVDPSAAASALAQRYQVPYFSALDQLLASAKPDGIVLATPNALHVPQALQCVAAGVPVLLEKPMATSVEEGQTLVDAVVKADARVLIGHHRAHSPIMQQARSVVASGQLGRLVAISGSATFFKPDSYFSDAPWRKELGAGPILINLIHEIHNLRMLCGEIVAVQAFASAATRGFAVEDTVAISLRFANGALGSFLLSDTAASPRSWEQTSQENPHYASYADEDCYVVSGTMGSLSVPTMRLKTYAKEADRSWFKPFQTDTVTLVREDPLVRQMVHFGDVVRGHVRPLVTVHDGLANQCVTQAIVEASRTGATALINDPVDEVSKTQ